MECLIRNSRCPLVDRMATWTWLVFYCVCADTLNRMPCWFQENLAYYDTDQNKTIYDEIVI